MWRCGQRRVPGFLAFFLFCSALKASPLVQLQLAAPAECPSKDSIEETLARLVQRPPAVPLEVNARLAPDGQRWVLVAMLSGGQRVVGGDSCIAVAEALVVIIALAIDPAGPVDPSALQEFEQANASLVPPAQPRPAPSAVAAPKPRASAVAPSSTDGGWRMAEAEAQARASATMWHPRKPDRLGLSASLLAEWGALPKATLGPTLFVRYGSPLRWGELSVGALYPRLEYEAASTTKGERLTLVQSQLGGCAAPGYEWPVAACVGAELGDLIGQGVKTDADETRHTLWSAFTAGVIYRAELGSDFGVELRLGAAIPFRRREFVVKGPLGVSTATFTPGFISGRGLVGISWR